MTSAIARSTSLPSVDGVSEVACRQREPAVGFYSGSLRHKDSILLRKSKLKQVQQRPPPAKILPVSGEDSHIKQVVVRVGNSGDSSANDFGGCSELPPRLDRNWDVSEVRPARTGIVAAWTAGDQLLPEFVEQRGREPAASRRQWYSNAEDARFTSRNSTSKNKLTVILSAVDLPYHMTTPSALSCECQSELDLRRLPSGAGWRCPHQYLVGRPSTADGRYPAHGTWPEPMDRRLRLDAQRSSSSASPEPFLSSLSGRGSQWSGVTSQRRVYALARAYSDRVKQLQRRSTTTHRDNDFDDAANRRVSVVGLHPARACSVIVGRPAANTLLSSPYVLYK